MGFASHRRYFLPQAKVLLSIEYLDRSFPLAVVKCGSVCGLTKRVLRREKRKAEKRSGMLPFRERAMSGPKEDTRTCPCAWRSKSRGPSISKQRAAAYKVPQVSFFSSAVWRASKCVVLCCCSPSGPLQPNRRHHCGVTLSLTTQSEAACPRPSAAGLPPPPPTPECTVSAAVSAAVGAEVSATASATAVGANVVPTSVQGPMVGSSAGLKVGRRSPADDARAPWGKRPCPECMGVAQYPDNSMFGITFQSDPAALL